jgi:hypothetical protein
MLAQSNVAVEVKSVITNAEGAISVEVDDGASRWRIEGSSLQGLVLILNYDTTVIHLRIGEATAQAQGTKVFWTYTVEYSVPSVPDVWKFTCNDGSGKAAFLGGRIVHGLTGAMWAQAGTVSAVTMACVSGSIGGCMAWGYRPWEASLDTQDAANYLFGTCVQAKRAAYFVQSGNYKSYTLKGTPISVQDLQGIMPAGTMPGVEALWSPQGASCFSPEYRRVSVSGTLPPLPSGYSVPPCPASLHAAAQAGTLQSQLTSTTPFATGPAN